MALLIFNIFAKLQAIEEFIHKFDLENKDLIQVMNNHPIALPAPYRDINYKNICLSKKRMTVSGKHGITYITIQELNCLQMTIHGATLKEIAQLLEVSPRTVETYLLRIRQRTGFFTRLELKEMLLAHQIL